MRSVLDTNQDPRDHRIVFDFSTLKFIEGEGLTALSNTLEWLYARDVDCRFHNICETTAAICYLDDCGFFREHLGEPLRNFARVRPTTIPCEKIQHDRSHAWLEGKVSPWLEAKLHIGARSFGSIRTCIKEVFNNIDEHSTEHIGCSHIQWYPRYDQISVTISDFGIGIPGTIWLTYQGTIPIYPSSVKDQDDDQSRFDQSHLP